MKMSRSSFSLQGFALFLTLCSSLLPWSVGGSPLSEPIRPERRVVETEECKHDEFYNISSHLCQPCKICGPGFEPNPPCSSGSSQPTVCEACSRGTYSQVYDVGQCIKHTNCFLIGRQTVFKGNSTHPSICSSGDICLDRYTFDLDTGLCVDCNLHNAAVCERTTGEDSVTVNPNQETGSTNDTSSDGPFIPRPPPREGSPVEAWLIHLVVIVVGITCVSGIVIISLLTVYRCLPRGFRLNRWGGTIFTRMPPDQEYELKVPSPAKEVKDESAQISVVHPKLPPNASKNVSSYKRQVSDSAALTPPAQRLLSASESVFGTSSGTDALLQLLSSKDTEDATFWKMEVTGKLYTNLHVWELAPSTRLSLASILARLPAFASINLSRAISKTFQLPEESYPMDQLIGAVISTRPSTQVSELLNVLYDHSSDAVIAAVCDCLISAFRQERTGVGAGGDEADGGHTITADKLEILEEEEQNV